jgi:hypothetical protein
MLCLLSLHTPAHEKIARAGDLPFLNIHLRSAIATVVIHSKTFAVTEKTRQLDVIWNMHQ